MIETHSRQQMVVCNELQRPVLEWEGVGKHFTITRGGARFVLSVCGEADELWLAEQLERIAVEIRVGRRMKQIAAESKEAATNADTPAGD